MKVTKFVLAGLLSAASGCANNRTYAPGSPGGGGTMSPVPDTTPSLGSPDPSPTGGASFFRGGPSLKLPEAFRDDPPLRSPRVSSRWPSPGGPTQTNRYRGSVPTAPVSRSDRPPILDEPAWTRVYRSTDRRVIETLQLGKGSRRVAILGSLHGDETQSVALVEELARYFHSHPEALQQATVLLVKSPNPDGLAGRSPYNIHGVDLNRNFPSANWKSLSSSRAGSKAASEAETRVVVRLLSEFRPGLVVHLKDSKDRTLVNSEGNARNEAEQIARILHAQAVEGFGARTSGSVENYAATQLKCPALTLLLAVEASEQAAWANDRDALLAIVGAGPATIETGARENDAQSFERPTVVKSSLRKPQSLPEFPAPIPDRGYVELPPP